MDQNKHCAALSAWAIHKHSEDPDLILVQLVDYRVLLYGSGTLISSHHEAQAASAAPRLSLYLHHTCSGRHKTIYRSWFIVLSLHRMLILQSFNEFLFQISCQNMIIIQYMATRITGRSMERDMLINMESNTAE